MVIGAIGAGIFGGALGGGLAVTVLAPLTAANNFLGSYFFGSGMILGERQMYQDDWIKIKKRLDAGESFLVILEEVMKPNTQAVMQMARETVIAVSTEWNDIVLKYLQSIPQSIWDAINKIYAGEALDDPWPLGEGIIGIINGVVQCHTDYHKVGNTCVLNDQRVTAPVVPTPPSTQPPPTIPPGTVPREGDQPEVKGPLAVYPVAPAILKLYNQFKSELVKLYVNRVRVRAAATAARRLGSNSPAYKNALKMVEAINKLITNKVNQIKLMEKSYPNLSKQ